MAHYLITGAAGFIGTNFVYHVLRHDPGAYIIAVDNLSFAANIENLRDASIHFIRADITDSEHMTSIYDTYSPDYVINFAAESHNDRAIINPHGFMKSNALGAQTLLEVSRKHAVKHHIHISTIEVYGELPPGQAYFSEASALNAKTPYSAAKAAGDQIVRAYMHTYPQLRVSMTHCANNYGPYQLPEKLIPLAITHVLQGKPIPLYGDGGQQRDWLHVSDHCAAIYALLHSDPEPIPPQAVYRPELLPIYDISAEDEYTNLTIAQHICDHLGQGRIELVADRPNHDRRYLIRSNKLTQATGWKPHVPFTEGIAETIDWYCDNQDWWKNILRSKGELGISWNQK